MHVGLGCDSGQLCGSFISCVSKSVVGLVPTQSVKNRFPEHIILQKNEKNNLYLRPYKLYYEIIKDMTKTV